ncbi:MAG: hypothetical protein VX311_00060 [Planctomycetota bacterium]|nr:hypothetical protein [Planctomycetota bacterium]MEE3282945.1 hypothetical protein [Planctomycetota bacterium]
MKLSWLLLLLLVAVVGLEGDGWKRVSLPVSAFKTPDGKTTLGAWDTADQLGFRAYFDSRDGQLVGSKSWKGARPQFRNLRWTLSRP